MFSLLSFSGVASGVLNMTATFAPLFMGLVVLLGLSLLGIVLTVGVRDIQEEKPQMHLEKETLPNLPKAA